MPQNALVIMRYGPYSAVGLAVEHRTFRLEGLQAVLAEDGHQVILEKIEDWNMVELMVNEEVVFHCNITDLEFGVSSQQNNSCLWLFWDANKSGHSGLWTLDSTCQNKKKDGFLRRRLGAVLKEKGFQSLHKAASQL